MQRRGASDLRRDLRRLDRLERVLRERARRHPRTEADHERASGGGSPGEEQRRHETEQALGHHVFRVAGSVRLAVDEQRAIPVREDAHGDGRLGPFVQKRDRRAGEHRTERAARVAGEEGRGIARVHPVREAPVPRGERQQQEEARGHAEPGGRAAEARRGRVAGGGPGERDGRGDEDRRQLERALGAEYGDEHEPGPGGSEGGSERAERVDDPHARSRAPPLARETLDHRREDETEAQSDRQDEDEGLRRAREQERAIGDADRHHHLDLRDGQMVEHGDRDGDPRRGEEQSAAKERAFADALAPRARVQRAPREQSDQIGEEEEGEGVSLRAEEDGEMPRPDRLERERGERGKEEGRENGPCAVRARRRRDAR